MYKLLQTLTPRFLHKAVAVMSCGFVISSLTAQYVFGKLPCHLCLISRYTYVAIFVISLILIFNDRSILKKMLVIASVFLLSFSFYHLGVENKWWPGPKSCTTRLLQTSDQDPEVRLAQAADHIFNAPVIKCDNVNWRVFGISSTIYNFLIAAFLFWLISVSYLLGIQRRCLDE